MSDVVDLDELYPLAWGTDSCTRCGQETPTTDAWGTPWCESCWAERWDDPTEGVAAGGVEGDVPQDRGSGAPVQTDAENGDPGQEVGLTAATPEEES